MLELKSNSPPGLLSAPARKRTETHKTISESTTNTIKTLAMLRARSHLLSHKKSLVLSRQTKGNQFLNIYWQMQAWGQGSTCRDLLGARLPWAPAIPCPPVGKKPPLLIPGDVLPSVGLSITRFLFLWVTADLQLGKGSASPCPYQLPAWSIIPSPSGGGDPKPFPTFPCLFLF